MSRLAALLALLLTSPLCAGSPRVDASGDPLPTGAMKRLGTQRFHPPGCRAIALSPDGKTLATGSGDTVCFYDMTTGRQLRSLSLKLPLNAEGTGPINRVHIETIVYSPDSKRVAVVGRDMYVLYSAFDTDTVNHSLFLVDSALGKAVFLDRHERSLLYVPEFSGDGRLLVGPPQLTVWDAVSGKEVSSYPVPAVSFALSPDGSVLATALKDGTVYLRNLATGRARNAFDESLRCASVVSVSPDGRLLAVGTNMMNGPENSKHGERAIRLYDVASGKELRRLKRPPIFGPFLEWQSDDLLAIQFSPDGKTLIERGDGPRLFLWNVATGRTLTPIPNKGPFRAGACAFSPDSKLLAWVETDGQAGDEAIEAWDPNHLRGRSTVRLWDVAAGKEIRSWPAKQCDAAPLCFTPDGKTLIAGGSSLVMWDVATGKELPPFDGHRTSLRSLTYSPDGTRLASLDHNGRLLLWDAIKGERLPLPFQCADEQTLTCDFSADGTEVISVGQRQVHVWAASDGKLRRSWRMELPVGFPILSRDRRLIATLAQGSPQVYLWDASTGKCLHILAIDGQGMAFSPDSRYLVHQAHMASLDIYDCTTGQRRNHFEAHSPPPEPGHPRIFPTVSYAFSPDGVFLAWSDEKDIVVWDSALNRQLWKTNGQKIYSPQLTFSLDGKALFCCSNGDRTLRAWDAVNGKELRRQEMGPRDSFETPAFHAQPDGKTLVGISRENGPHALHPVLDALTGREVRSWMSDVGWSHLVWSPDARVAVSRKLTFYCRGGRALARLPHRNTWLDHFTFSPGGKTLATSDSDGTILLWDVSGFKGAWPPQLVTYPAFELKSLWQRLASKESHDDAVHELLASPRQAVPFLRARVRSLAMPDLPRLRRQIANLDSDEFEVRESATRELVQFGKLAEDDLRKTLGADSSPEVKRRITELFAHYRIAEELSPEMLQFTGARRVLELLGTDAATKVLRDIGCDSQAAAQLQSK